jgi:cytochrome c oxidase subunit 3
MANTLEPTLNQDDFRLEEATTRERALKLLLWLGQVSIGMLFAGLTAGYIVRKYTGNWMVFQLPSQFWISTAIIIISSISMNWAMQSIKKENYKALTQAIIITLVLGIVFIISQIMGWSALIRANIYAMGDKSSASGSYLYIITALHIAHILGGLAALSIVLFKSVKHRYTSANHLGIKLCATYWHFLDGLWVYLFLFMLFIR